MVTICTTYCNIQNSAFCPDSILSRCRGCVTYKTGSGLDDLICCTLYIHNSGLQAIQRSRWSTHFTVHRYTCTRVLCFHKSYPGNGFISLTVNFTHEVFFALPNFFLAMMLDSIQFLCSQTHFLAGWRLELDSSLYYFSTEVFFITTLHGSCRKHRLSLVGKACLQRRCTAT
jgi:hypothetical protein